MQPQKIKSTLQLIYIFIYIYIPAESYQSAICPLFHQSAKFVFVCLHWSRELGTLSHLKQTALKYSNASKRCIIESSSSYKEDMVWTWHCTLYWEEKKPTIWGGCDTLSKSKKHLRSIDTCVQLSQTYSVHVDNRIVQRETKRKNNQTSILYALWSVTVLSGMRKKEDLE